METKVKIKDIEEYLKELGFKWEDNLIKDHITQMYQRATEQSLKRDMKVYMENLRTKKKVLANLSVNERKFILNQAGNTMDMSEDWVAFLGERHGVDSSCS